MTPSGGVRSSPADGYWKKAYDSLDDNLRTSINCAKTGKHDILAAVLKTADQKRAVCIHKQWKVKLPGGEVIIIRDLLEKIGKWVNAFIAVGDVAVQYDPAAAALPWAAVRFVLQAAISDTQIEGATVADLEVVSRLIARYREFEQIHLKRESSVKRQMEEALTHLYADVLRFLATAVKYFDTNTFTRGIKNAFKIPDRVLMENIMRQEAELLRIAGLSDTEKLHYLQDSVKRLVDQTARVQKALDEAQHLQLLQWLSSCPFTRHQEALSETRMPNSATWLLDHSEYRSWKNSSSSSILLLYGIPGSGKSRICSAVVDSFLEECATTQQAAPVAYFYCADCEFEPERAQPGEVMRSILRQLTMTIGTTNQQPMVRDILLSEFERRLAQSKVDGMDMPKLTVKECAQLILEVTTADPVTIVVDALDQVSEHDRPALISALEEIVVKSSSVAKVFLTSRNNSQVFSLLRGEKPGKQTASTQQNGKFYIKNIETTSHDTLLDMNAYVELKVAQAVKDRRLLKRDPSPELSHLLIEKLVAGASEMFQWVNVQVEYLCQFDREEDMVAALQSGALATLDDTYLLILERILNRRNTSRDIAVRVFSWLLYMREAMSPDAFLAAVFTQTTVDDPTRDREDLLTICSSLVLLDSTCDTFRFSHHSVQEFLRSYDLFSPASAQQILAARCLRVCMDGPSVDSLSPDAGSPDALYRYAALYWAYHCSRVVNSDDQKIISRAISSFVYDEPGDISLSFMGWLDHVARISKCLADDHPMKTIGEAIPNPEGSPLFVASAFGLDCLLRNIVLGADTIDWDQKNDQGHTSLYLACATDRISVARTLLAQGADPNFKCGKFGNPLQAACFAGHTSVAELLLEHGASIRAEGKFRNALEACFRGDKETTALVLLKYKHTIQNATEFDWAIGGAAQVGFLQVIEYLEKSPLAEQYGVGRADKIKIKTGKAIQGGQTGTLAAFLKNKPNPEGLLPDGSMAMAAIYGHETIVDILGAMNIDPEGECKLGSPLRCAALMGYERVVHKLIELGAKTDGCGQHGTALQAASMKGHIRVVRLLLRSGAHVNQEGGTYGTALQAAAYHGHYEVAKALLDAGAEVHIERSTGISRDAFHAAAEGGHYEIVQLMLDKGFRYYGEFPGPSFSMGLPRRDNLLLRNYSASWKGSKRGVGSTRNKATSTMELEPIKLSYQDIYSRMEAATGHPGNDEELRQSGSFKCPRRREYYPASDPDDYALQVSAAAGHLQTVAILLERKSDLGMKDDEVLASLQAAARYGHAEVFHMIFASLPSPLPVDMFIEGLKEAAANGHINIVNFGIEQVPTDSWSDERLLETFVDVACRTTPAVVDKMLPLVAEQASATILGQMFELGLVEAAKYGRDHVVNLLLKEIHFQEETTRDAFMAACLGQHISVVSTLLRGADRDLWRVLISDGLNISTKNGHLDLVVSLFDHLSSAGERVVLTKHLIAAAGDGRLDLVKVFLRWRGTWENYTADVTQALTIASFNGHEETVNELIAAGADVNATVFDITGHRHRQHTSGEEKEAGSSGPSINALQAALAGLRLSQSEKRLTIALRRCGTTSDREKVVKMLLDHGSDSNNLGGCNMFPIIIAAKYCSEQVVRWLIDAGADVNAVADGHNAILAASEGESAAAGVLRLLLEVGAHLQSNAYSVEKLFSACLDYFTEDDRFLQIETLEDAMTKGPGAVAEILLKAFPLAKAEHRNFQALLQSAVVLDDRAYVDLLLDRGVEVNAAGFYYGTALQAAARFDRLELGQRLLEVGADPNVLQGRHHTPLRAAVVAGHATFVQLLLQHGADINLAFTHEPDSYEVVPVPLLNLAVESGNTDIVSALISAGIDVVADPPGHIHPLILACSRVSIQGIECLLEAGAPAGIHGKRRSHYYQILEPDASPLHMACHHGREDIIQLLLNHNIEIDMEFENSGTPLQLAANSGHAGAVRLLLEAGAHVDRVSGNKKTALSIAARQGHLSTVRELLAAKATIYDPERLQNSLESACHSRSPVVLEFLLEATVAMENGEQAIMDCLKAASKEHNDEMLRLLSEYVHPSIEVLHNVCVAGSLRLVSMMIERGVPVDGEDENGARALDLAARHLQPGIVKLLVERGADLDHWHPTFGNGCVERGLPQRRANSYSSWYSRRWRPDGEQISKCEQIVRFLVDHGVAPDTESGKFGLALHLACVSGSQSIIRTVLSAGANVNSEAGYFRTPLLAATYQTHLEVVELLLREGGQVNYNHPELGTPLFLACHKSDLRVPLLILDYGGDPNILGPDGSSPLAMFLANDSHMKELPPGETNSTLLQAFLNKAKGLKLRSSDLTEAAKASFREWFPVKALLDYDKEITVPEEAVIASLEKNCVETLRLLLERSGDLGVTEAMLLKAKNKEEVSILLEHRPRCPITATIVEAQRYYYDQIEIMELLLRHEPSILPTETMVMHVLELDRNNDMIYGKKTVDFLKDMGVYEDTYGKKTADMLEDMWARNPDLHVTQEMLENKELTPETAKWLLSHASGDFRITQAMLFSTEDGFHASVEVMRVLLQHEHDFEITGEMAVHLIKHTTGYEILGVFLEHNPNMAITESIFLAAFGGVHTRMTAESGKELIQILRKHDKKLRYTVEMRKAVDETFLKYSDAVMKELFFNLDEAI